jgi:hypothetical protein
MHQKHKHEPVLLLHVNSQLLLFSLAAVLTLLPEDTVHHPRLDPDVLPGVRGHQRGQVGDDVGPVFRAVQVRVPAADKVQ